MASTKLPEVVRELLTAGWRVEAEGRQVRTGGAAKVSVTSGVDWFDLRAEVDFGGLSASLPELLAALSLGLPVASMPQTLRTEFLAGRHPVVIAGTHGKTTTTALTARLPAAAAPAPGHLVAGPPRHLSLPHYSSPTPPY